MLKTEESRPLASFVEQAYLDYSLYVILDRALPFVGDGLKPVQRRIIYAMAELGLAAPAKPKKSARTVGDVIGKYHPHGDSACYEAMVHMAQPFSQRYPLIDGQGNWGSSDDPKSFAAMRYTESRLSPYAKALLQDLATAEFRPNFDSSLTEPTFLPARLPNVLLNGATGIAVGMATLILPHNLTEIVAACQALLANPELDDEALHQLVPGPDFPGGGVIVSTPEELASLYRTGRGTVRQRAAYEIDGKRIIITALPYQLAGARLQEQIAKLVQQKKLPLLEEMRDESDHENPVRLVLTAKSSREAPRLLEQLWASTDLEKRFSSQMNVIGLDGRPAVKSLKTLLTEWLSFRRQNLRIRCQQALQQLQERLAVLAALRTVFQHLDETIEIIRNGDDPAAELTKRFAFSAEQLAAVLNLRLRALARLEEAQLRREQQQSEAEAARLQRLLDDEKRLDREIGRELAVDSVLYQDGRRCRLEPTAAAGVPSLPPSDEPLTVVFSRQGWVRAGKGHQLQGEALPYKTGDGFLCQLATSSAATAVLFGSDGRVHNLGLQDLPSARGYGEPLAASLSLDPTASLLTAVVLEPRREYLVLSDRATAFRCRGEDLRSGKRQGKALLTLAPEARALALLPLPTDADAWALQLTLSNGSSRTLPLATVPLLSKGKGKSLLRLPPPLRLVAASLQPARPELSLLD